MEFRKPQSIFEQIANHICNAILVDEFAAGEKIPSVRQMAAELQVNPNTMMRAYAFLQEQEVLINRRGVGFFVATDARQRIMAKGRAAFLREDLPVFFDSLIRLQIDISEIAEHFEQYKKGKIE